MLYNEMIILIFLIDNNLLLITCIIIVIMYNEYIYFFKFFVMTFYKNVSKIYIDIFNYLETIANLILKRSKMALVETGIWAKRTASNIISQKNFIEF